MRNYFFISTFVVSILLQVHTIFTSDKDFSISIDPSIEKYLYEKMPALIFAKAYKENDFETIHNLYKNKKVTEEVIKAASTYLDISEKDFSNVLTKKINNNLYKNKKDLLILIKAHENEKYVYEKEENVLSELIDAYEANDFDGFITLYNKGVISNSIIEAFFDTIQIESFDSSCPEVSITILFCTKANILQLLYKYIEDNDVEKVKAILEKTAQLPQEVILYPKSYISPLAYACLYGKIEIVKIFLQEYNLDPNETNKYYKPIYFHIIYDHSNIYCCSNEITDKALKLNPLSACFIFNKDEVIVELIDLLLSYNCNPMIEIWYNADRKVRDYDIPPPILKSSLDEQAFFFPSFLNLLYWDHIDQNTKEEIFTMCLQHALQNNPDDYINIFKKITCHLFVFSLTLKNPEDKDLFFEKTINILIEYNISIKTILSTLNDIYSKYGRINNDTKCFFLQKDYNNATKIINNTKITYLRDIDKKIKSSNKSILLINKPIWWIKKYIINNVYVPKKRKRIFLAKKFIRILCNNDIDSSKNLEQIIKWNVSFKSIKNNPGILYTITQQSPTYSQENKDEYNTYIISIINTALKYNKKEVITALKEPLKNNIPKKFLNNNVKVDTTVFDYIENNNNDFYNLLVPALLKNNVKINNLSSNKFPNNTVLALID